MPQLEVRPVGPDQLALLHDLFATTRQTRHCWCTAFCSTRWQFARGWYGNGNRRRLETLAGAEDHPLGVIAMLGAEAIGWCACGPQIRYKVGSGSRSQLIAERTHETRDPVWHVACFFVRPDHQGGSIAVSLLRAAISLARDSGASAVQAWPLPLGYRSPAQAHLGAEAVFRRLGFDRLQ